MRCIRHSKQENFVEDTRGAILVFGLFGASFLVGMLYYTVSLGEVLMQREGMQQAADASASSVANLSARGMNMIAVINIMMAAIITILMPVRAMLPAYQKVAAMPCLDPCTCAIVADGARASAQLQGISQRAEQQAANALRALSDAQNAIAQNAPKMGQQAANNAARSNDVWLKTGTAEIFSPSINKQGCRLGLPVQEDTNQTACTRGKPYAPELVQRIAGPTLQTLGACKSGPLALADAAAKVPNIDREYCKEAQSPACTGGGGGGGSPHVKKVFSEAKNGNDYMAFWSQVRGKQFDKEREGVEIAAYQKGKTYDEGNNIAFAQSEIYFDCTGDFATCNKDEHAMWAPRWTSRLRRVHTPVISFAGDTTVKQVLANNQRWNQMRKQLLESRNTPWGDGKPTKEAALLLMQSEEGPLQ